MEQINKIQKRVTVMKVNGGFIVMRENLFNNDDDERYVATNIDGVYQILENIFNKPKNITKKYNKI